MYYLAGHIRCARLLAGCFSPLLPAACLNVTAGTPDLSERISVISLQASRGQRGRRTCQVWKHLQSEPTAAVGVQAPPFVEPFRR